MNRAEPARKRKRDEEQDESLLSTVPASKKASTEQDDVVVEDSDSLLVKGGHPFGVKPWGNYFMDKQTSKSESREGRETTPQNTRTDGLGLFSLMSDDLLLDFLVFIEDPRDVCNLAAASKVMYVFCSDEDLWKEHVAEKYEDDWVFDKTWKRTYMTRSDPNYKWPHAHDVAPFTVDGLYSDILYHAWRCATLDLHQFEGEETIPRRSNLSADEFIREYGIPNKPVVITDIVPNWAAYRDWTREGLISKYGNILFKIGRVQNKLVDYFKYSDESLEDTPLYLFDNDFGEKAPEMLSEFSVPPYFREDYFSLLKGNDRPSYRWLLVGPARSGSTFHKDPNFTSAWNGLISGLKKWVMYPPDKVPPGVFPSGDGFDVTTSVNATEWFINFYKDTKMKGAYKPLECLQGPGDLVFIPHAWWHTALNLEPSIAVTQNVVNRENVANVVEFLRKKTKQALTQKFEAALRENYPNVMAEVEAELKSREDAKKRRADFESMWDTSDSAVWTLNSRFGNECK